MIKKNLFFLFFLFGVGAGLQAESRKVIAFNDKWQFKKGPFPKEQIVFMGRWDQKWQSVSLPHTWNAKDMQLEHNKFYAGEAYYKKSFLVDHHLKDKQVFIKFEGVGQVADLYVNDKFIGKHKGAYSAFSYDITAALVFGEENEFLVKADNAARPDVIPVNHSLFGVYGGIYRPVWLIVTEKAHFAVTDHASSGVYVSQSNVSRKQADVEVKMKLANEELQPTQLTLETLIFNADGKRVQKSVSDIELQASGLQSFTHRLKIRQPHLWQGRKDPYLYKVVCQLKDNGEVIDEVVQPLGLRKVEVVAGKGVFLNGEKYPMYGVCRHQDWWEIGSALQNHHHDADLAMIMEIGATTIRLAHYQQSDYIYSKCDSLGLLIWAEIPFVNRVTGDEAANAKEQLRELIRQSFNHPSIYIWGLHNEVYRPQDYTAHLTQDLHDLAKTEDPGRYTVTVSGYGHMEHPVNMNADIQGMNRYFGWYEKTIESIEQWAIDLEQKYPNQKLMLTEYGADSNIHHQTEYIGNTIKWYGDYFPETYQTKMHEVQWGVIAKHPYITASYLWNMFDFAVPMWKRGGVEARNLKGIVTIDRKVRKDAFYWYKANWSEEPVVYMTQRRNTDREKKTTSVTVYSNIGVPTIKLNGKIVSNHKIGTTDVHYIFENVELEAGENTIEASVVKNGTKVRDEIHWIYSGEKKRESESFLNSEAHYGF
ncbi:MAG: beta-galactosidase [Marinilabiliaceae bacterium]|nr:beta-galactosidase [Marinilabiliaceae bacterium]